MSLKVKLFLLFALLITSSVVFGMANGYANTNRAKFKSEVRLICDFKNEKVNFYRLYGGKIILSENVGMESVDLHSQKFIGIKIEKYDNSIYVFGWLLSLNSESGRIAPDPVGTAYVKSDDLFCVNVNAIF